MSKHYLLQEALGARHGSRNSRITKKKYLMTMIYQEESSSGLLYGLIDPPIRLRAPGRSDQPRLPTLDS
jgi:hypothetical protein